MSETWVRRAHPKAVTIKEALRFAIKYLKEHQLPTPRADAELIVSSILHQQGSVLYSHPERPLNRQQERLLYEWLHKRGEHYPLQYLRGRQEFYGRDFAVHPGVFIPRPETELLVETSLQILAESSADPLYGVDVGTGSGCIAVTLACENPRVLLVATDISETALEMARQNAQKHGCLERIEFLKGTVLEPVKDRRSLYHLIVSNPPYVSTLCAQQVDASVRNYEPPEAVFAGESAQEVYRVLLAQAKPLLRPGGKLVIELGYDAADYLSMINGRGGWLLLDLRKDLSGISRCAVLEPKPD